MGFGEYDDVIRVLVHERRLASAALKSRLASILVAVLAAFASSIRALAFSKVVPLAFDLSIERMALSRV
jgi:hypothetical protein